MSGVRVLVGTRKGAFILTSDGKRQNWDVNGPYFGGWEIYHIKGSPADPNRLYVSQSSSWFGQLIQRSDNGGKSWEPVGNQFTYTGNAPRSASKNSFGHSGFTGTFVWVEPDYNLSYVFLSNRVYPTRNNNLISSLNTRTYVAEALYRATKRGLRPN